MKNKINTKVLGWIVGASACTLVTFPCICVLILTIALFDGYKLTWAAMIGSLLVPMMVWGIFLSEICPEEGWMKKIILQSRNPRTDPRVGDVWICNSFHTPDIGKKEHIIVKISDEKDRVWWNTTGSSPMSWLNSAFDAQQMCHCHWYPKSEKYHL